MNDLIESIIALEWDEFQKVNNEGGRASCQDNWPSFRIYRGSTFQAWSDGMLESYHQDLLVAAREGRNLLTEKYARMMKSTAPVKYREMADKLPSITEETGNMIEDICRISVKWAEEFAREYPLLSGNGRPIHTSEDSPLGTSFETYARGELGTYSEATLRLYRQYTIQLLEEGRNLSRMIMENTVHQYGYSSLDQAEKGIAGQMASSQGGTPVI